jgi:hypothetical protein
LRSEDPPPEALFFFETLQPSCKNPVRALPWTTPDLDIPT